MKKITIKKLNKISELNKIYSLLRYNSLFNLSILFGIMYANYILEILDLGLTYITLGLILLMKKKYIINLMDNVFDKYKLKKNKNLFNSLKKQEVLYYIPIITGVIILLLKSNGPVFLFSLNGFLFLSSFLIGGMTSIILLTIFDLNDNSKENFSSKNIQKLTKGLEKYSYKRKKYFYDTIDFYEKEKEKIIKPYIYKHKGVLNKISLKIFDEKQFDLKNSDIKYLGKIEKLIEKEFRDIKENYKKEQKVYKEKEKERNDLKKERK